MKFRNAFLSVLFLSALVLGNPDTIQAQKDPGPRGGPPDAGSFYPTLNSNEQAFFDQALLRFGQADSVSGTIEPGKGLGPRFNGNSCAMCHLQPALGGSSPGLTSPQNSVPNPQVQVATLDGATNSVPPFITDTGPVREARFILKSDGSLDGSVHELYTIKGRSDAPGCNLAQPDFAAQLAAHNVVFRIPTPLFGLGLVENTPDAALRANLAATAADRKLLGIVGTFNISDNDGTITRFGWKAQNKSLLMFVGEASNVEQGVSNDLFPNEIAAVSSCIFNATPEDTSNILNGNSNSPHYQTPVGTVSEMSSNIVNFAAFIRLSAPPTPVPPTTSAANGSQLFRSIGCALCHSPSLTTAESPFTGMGGVTYHPFSDFALHHMGSGLADGIIQGRAGPDEFRTAPLWGIGQRLFFLHDGRTFDLLQAILAHAGRGNDDCRGGQSCRSEATAVINKFKALTHEQQQDILNFLRSL